MHFLNVNCNSIKTKLKQIKNNLRITRSSRSLSHPLQGSRGLGVLWRLSLMSTRLPRKNPHCLRQMWWANFHTLRKRRWGAWGLSEPNKPQNVFLQVCHNSVNQNVIPERLPMVPASKPLPKCECIAAWKGWFGWRDVAVNGCVLQCLWASSKERGCTKAVSQR